MTNTFFSYSSKDGKIFGNIDFNKLKSGITKQELGIEEGSVLSSIFDSLDTNEEEGSKGKLDRQEINKFIQIISSLAGDTKIDGKEAGKYKVNGEKIDKTGNELLNFISKLSKLTNDVSNVEVKENSEVVNYANGNIEEVFTDGSKFIKEKVGNQVQERVLDANGKVVKFTIIEHGEIIRDENTTYDENGEPKFQEVTEIANAWNTDHRYGTMINTKRHNVHSLYEYNKTTKQFELKSHVEKYINEDNQNQTNFKVINDDGTEEYVEVVDNLTRYHSCKKGFKFEEIKFDKDGCLTGYFIQNGETSKSIAEKFGISEDLLKRANPGVAFLPMTEIRIPKQVDLDDPAVQSRKSKDEIWKDLPKAQIDWDDADGNMHHDELAIIKSKLKHGWQIAVSENGTQYILNSKGEVLSEEEIAEQLAWDAAPKTKTSDGKVVVVLQKSIPQYPKCSWVRDRAGNTYVLNKDNKLCNPNDLFSYADTVTAHYNNGITTRVIVVREGEKHGWKVVQEQDGTLRYMDSDNRIIPNEEVAKTNYKDEIKSKPETAMKAVITIIRKAYQNARAAFEKQCREQGWTAHAADSIAGFCWDSDNTEEKVRQKLDYYEAQIRMLEQCMSMGRYNDFKGTFYEMFKVNFNENSLINYIDNPSLDNYYRIFGKNNDVGEMVGKYNSSQNLGSDIVKVATSVVVGIAGAAAIPFTGGASSVIAFAGFAGVTSAVVSLTDRVSSVVGLQEGDLTEIAKQAGWDAVSALAGGAVSKVAGAAIKGTTALATMSRMGIELAGDAATGAVQELVEKGEITREGLISSMIFSAGGNLAFHGIGKGMGAIQALKRSSSPDIAGIEGHTSTKPIEVQPKTPTVTQPEIKTPKISEEVHTQPKGEVETPIVPKKKTISEMNENELLAEHNRLRQETLSETITKDLKLENIRQMKEIEQTLSQKGLKIEQGKLEKIIQEPKTEPQTQQKPTEQTVTSKADLKAKLGQTLFEFHEMIENSIEKMQTLADFTRLKNVITTKFKDFSDVMSELLTKLENKAKQLGLNIKEGLSDIGNNLAELEQRIGKKLTKLFTKITDAINNMSTEKQFNKISKSINKHFAEFDDIMSGLFTKLETKAKQIGLNVEKQLSHKKSFQPVKTPLSDLQPINPQIVKGVAQKYHCPVLDCNYGAKTFQRGNKFVVDLATNKDTQISLGPLVSVDLNEPRLAYLLKNLKEGESITIGSFDGNATYRIGSSYNGVSHQHLKVTKENGVLVFEDTSTYGTKASLNKAQPISSKEVKNMFKNGTMDNSYYISKVHHSHMKLDSTDYKLIAELMNKCNGKYRNLWESTCILDNGRNIDKLAAFVKNIRMHGTEKFYTNMDDRTWSTVVNSICQKQNNSVDAVLGYKFGSNVINHSLSEHFAYPPTDKAINAMTDYINTQTIDKRVTIYRGDQYAFMNLAKLPNGSKIGDVMEDMIRRGASQQEINTFINKYLIGNVYKQERFMSCGLNREFCSDWAKKNGMDQSHPNPNGSILWELDVPAGSKAAFVEDYNIIKDYGDEGEVLFQQGSILIIKGAYFDKTRNQWIIQASVRQTPYEQLQRF